MFESVAKGQTNICFNMALAMDASTQRVDISTFCVAYQLVQPDKSWIDDQFETKIKPEYIDLTH